ncbi:MAG: NAD(P)/FAD-dependent oxidoreductase [Thermoanaerobaculia bacterium]
MSAKIPHRCDLLIIGGGPAGATLASMAARHGVSVVVLERDSFPRDKVCGEFLSWDAFPILERIGAMDAIARCTPARITRALLVTPRRVTESPLPQPAYGISRMKLDEILLRNATAAGAFAAEECVVESLERSNAGHAVVVRPRGGEPLRIEAKLTVGAWGRWGRLDLNLGRKFTSDRRQRHIGFKRHYAAGLTAPDVIELHPFAGGYLGAQPIEGSRSNLCGLVHQSEISSLKGGWPRFTENLAASSTSLHALFAAAEPLQDEFLSSDPVIFRAKEPVHEGAILIGDSAGLIDPLTGNGMAMAIQSAALAAPFALAILGGADRMTLLSAYARAHRELFAARLRWSRLAAAALRRPGLVAAGNAAGIASPLLELFTTRTRAGAKQVERLAREI